MPSASRPTLPIVGRDRELETLERALKEHRLVTLWGPPGVGKSRLATEYCARRKNVEEAGPLVHLDLALSRTLGDLSAIMAQGLGLEHCPEPSDTAELGRLLAERGRQLVVLDNLDQCASGALHAIARWRTQAPDTTWLVTARERLGLSDERTIEIEPLTPSAAVQLFARRARQADPSVELSSESSARLTLLVERLDCIPLAIELSAARVAKLSIEQLLAELGRGHDPASSLRHPAVRGLRDALCSAWTALSAPEQAVLAQCMAFVGPFTADAAQAVVDLSAFRDAPALLDMLQVLVDRSLVSSVESPAGGEIQFRVLLGVAEFVHAQPVASSVRAGAFRRHAAYFTKLGGACSERALTLVDRDAYQTLGEMREELIAVHQRALDPSTGLSTSFAVTSGLALLPLYLRFGPFGLMLERINRGLAAIPELHPRLLCKALGARGTALRMLGRLEESKLELERALELAREWDSTPFSLLIQLELAKTELERGEHETAQRLEQELLELCRTHHYRALEAAVLHALGGTRMFVDDHEGGRCVYEQALAINRELGDAMAECESLRVLALAELELGHRSSARAHFDQALAVIERVPKRDHRPYTVAYTLGCYGMLEHEQGNLVRAMSLYAEAIAGTRNAGTRIAEAIFRGYLATCLLEQGALSEARSTLERAIDDFGALDRMPVRALFRSLLAVIHGSRGDVDDGARMLQAAESELARLPEQVGVRRAVELHSGHLELARARRAALAGDTEVSVALYGKVRALLERPGVEQFAVRIARRLLQNAIDGWEPPRHAVAWRVHESGLWFEPPDRARIELEDSPALRRLLVTLARAQIEKQASPLSPAELIAAGWPDEGMEPHTASDQLRIALHTLQRMGLGELLMTTLEGYELDPGASIAIVSS